MSTIITVKHSCKNGETLVREHEFEYGIIAGCPPVTIGEHRIATGQCCLHSGMTGDDFEALYNAVFSVLASFISSGDPDEEEMKERLYQISAQIYLFYNRVLGKGAARGFFVAMAEQAEESDDGE